MEMHRVTTAATVCLLCLAAFHAAASAHAPTELDVETPTAASAPGDEKSTRSPVASPNVGAPVTKSDERALSWHGITLYGTIDINLSHQTHGAPRNDYVAQSVEYVLQKSGHASVFSLADNGLTTSFIGLRGNEDLGSGFSAIFRAETQFNPVTAKISDNLRSMTENNGVPLASQSSNNDSSRAGQIFQTAYAGVASNTWGTLTFGRQNGLGADAVQASDPTGGAAAFALIGFSGLTSGGGSTEDSRLNYAIKYRNTIDKIRFAGFFQFIGPTHATSARQIGLGTDWAGFSVDAVYNSTKYAVSTAPLAVVPAGFDPTKALAGTISDNEAWLLAAKYRYDAASFFAGYEHITYSNPATPVPMGVSIMGGYVLATVNNNAYAINKVQRSIAWTRNEIVFEGESVDSVVSEFNRYNNTQIVIADPRIAALTISGVFHTFDVRSFTQFLAELPNVRVIESDHVITITSAGEHSG
jgi:predicted porin